MSLASGHAVTRLVIKTLEDSIRIPALDRMGAVGPDCNCQEVLEFIPTCFCPMLDGFSK